MWEHICQAAVSFYNCGYFWYIVAIIVYLLYLKKFKYFVWVQPSTYQQGNKFQGKTLPSFPNGWFCACRSDELKNGQTRYLDYWGRQLALFRGKDGVAYCLDAYCAHMGANLAIAGEVKNTRCIQCPFHGWQFDGQTGNCVVSSQFAQREAMIYEYNEEVGGDGKVKEVFKSSGKPCKVKIQKYRLKEISGFIYIWLHAKETVDHQVEPQYEPLNISDFTNRLQNRGITLNLVKSHTQDITENGSDMLHFIFVHNELVPHIVGAHWIPKWIKASDPDLRKKLEHPVKWLNDYRMNLLDRYVTEQNKEHIGIVTLENRISIFGSKQIFMFSLTGFQVGPGIVYLFLKGPVMEILYHHFIKSKERLFQEVYTEMWTSWWVPYWASAMELRGEALQVQNDGVRWDNKKFGYNLNYDMTTDYDKALKEWREWYAQFYEGCKAFDQARANKGW